MTERLTEAERHDLTMHVHEARQRWRKLRRKLRFLSLPGPTPKAKSKEAS
jgi:hypothetical protein